MKYIVDIDGTICSLCIVETESGGTNNLYENAKPYKHRIEHFNKLYDEGHEIHYWTARGANSNTVKEKTALTEKQLKDWGVKFTSFKMGKPAYDVWIDDKAHNVDDYFERFVT
tara:strand:- start:30936 stop:31274 length:339 start_codon:yes stop_codon:yes gene_type:complete